MQLYQYRAVCDGVHDGDSPYLSIDKGFCSRMEKLGKSGQRKGVICRLAGLKARNSTRRALLWIRSEKLEKYGRPLVTLFEPEPTEPAPGFDLSVNAEMIRAGFAVLQSY